MDLKHKEQFDRWWNDGPSSVYLSVPMDEKLIKELCHIAFIAGAWLAGSEWELYR